jgi:hypothetical protein
MPRLDLLCYRLPLAEQINRPVYFSASSQPEIIHNIVQGTGWGIQAQREELAHKGRRRPIHSSSSPKDFLKNVISGIFPSSKRFYRLENEIDNFLRKL